MEKNMENDMETGIVMITAYAFLSSKVQTSKDEQATHPERGFVPNI